MKNLFGQLLFWLLKFLAKIRQLKFPLNCQNQISAKYYNNKWREISNIFKIVYWTRISKEPTFTGIIYLWIFCFIPQKHFSHFRNSESKMSYASTHVVEDQRLCLTWRKKGDMKCFLQHNGVKWMFR